MQRDCGKQNNNVPAECLRLAGREDTRYDIIIKCALHFDKITALELSKVKQSHEKLRGSRCCIEKL
jgi:hypothetical protein